MLKYKLVSFGSSGYMSGVAMVLKNGIAATGLGTRLLTATKEQPKEMLSLFANNNGGLYVRSMLQMIFRKLYGYDFREFYLTIIRGDHWQKSNILL